MTMALMPAASLLRRQSTKRKKVQFYRMYESHLDTMTNGHEDQDVIRESISEDDPSVRTLPPAHSRPTIHWGPVIAGDINGKEQINTDTDHFDALFARSNGSPPLHPRCYSSGSSVVVPTLSPTSTSVHLSTKSQPLPSSSPASKQKHTYEPINESTHRQPSVLSSSSSLASAQAKRKNFSLTHASQTFLQASHSQTEQLEPLARSCSYKRPQSMKKYRQKKKEKEQQQFPARKSSTTPTPPDCSRKSIVATTARVSATDLMATTNDPQDQWSSPKTQRAERVGSLPLDQLQLPSEGDEEIYLVRQFHTTSKGFVNRGDSFKRSIKRSGSTSRRSSFRTNPTITNADRTPSQEQDVNHSPSSGKETRMSSNSLSNSTSANLMGIVDSHFIENSSSPPSAPLHDQNEEEEDDDDDDDNPLVERVQNEDGRLQDIHVYQVYLLGMSGTGKCSLFRQFKSTEYRGIYNYSSSVDDDPDNTVSIMLDGIEARLHIITIDIDLNRTNVSGDAYVVVYSIADRNSFLTATHLIKSVRETELAHNQSLIKRHAPIILVGNKSDLVRKRAITKEIARHAALKYDCKFVETSAAINDKVDDLLAGTLKQIRIHEQFRNEQRRRLTVVGDSMDTNDSETAILTKTSSRKNSTVHNRHSKNVFSKFLNVFRKKPSRLPADVENLNIGIR